MSRLKLGTGANGPWENRTALVLERHPNPAIAGAWLNNTYSVQLFQHPTHPGIDHLCVRRHDEGTDIPWADMQRLKDRIADNGPERWGVEVFPPLPKLIDNCNLRHIWIMPLGYIPPVDISTGDIRV